MRQLTEKTDLQLTRHQLYASVLADIAIAASLKVHDSSYVVSERWRDGSYGKLRDHWLNSNPSASVREAALGLASAGATALTRLSADRLCAIAGTYGFDLPDDLATAIAEHFAERRAQVLTYRR